jgi:holo-[acyl-carrier protein] synthase
VREAIRAALGLDGLPGVGVDVEEVARWTDPDLRIFTPAEREHCAAGADSAERYAGRWCAKEAVVKALAPYVAASPRDVEILPDPAGRPLVRLAPRLGEVEACVTISHTGSVAVAVAVARVSTPRRAC